MRLDKVVPQPAFSVADNSGSQGSLESFWSSADIQALIDVELVKGLGSAFGFIPMHIKSESFEGFKGKSAEELLALGSYDHVGELAKKYDRAEDRIAADTLEVAFFNPAASRLTADILLEMERLGLRPLNAHELYALGALYPNLQSEKPLIALGSMQSFGPEIHEGQAVSPFLAMNDSGRGVDVDWCWKNGWLANCRFPVVRK